MKDSKKLKETGQNEISTTDPDARLMCNNNNNVDVSYNVQTTVDAKEKLIADFKVTQKPNDLGELDNMALRAKKLFGNKPLEALADKGYYNARDLKKCVENDITPYVSKQVYANGTGDRDFYADKFQYDKDKDIYICPAGKELTRGKTRNQKGRYIMRHVDHDFLDTIDFNGTQGGGSFVLQMSRANIGS